jgi:hypothetical protein
MYPVVVDSETGSLHFDTFNGRWGDEKQIDKFCQQYAVEAAREEARTRNWTIEETTLADGSIQCVLNTGGSSGLVGDSGAQGPGGYAVVDNNQY